MTDDTYDDEHQYLEKQAALILRHLDAQQPSPAIMKTNDTRALVDDLRHALDFDHEAHAEEILERQARALNKAFCRLLLEADTLYDGHDNCDASPALYACAFKAQDLFRRTTTSLNQLKSKKKTAKKVKKIRGKRP